MSHPSSVHWDAAVHVLKYLKGCSSQGIFFPANKNFALQAYTDADWGACVDSRKSVTGYCVFLGDSLISWKSKKQNTVSTSSAEAEYRAMSTTVRELMWITYLLADFQIALTLPIPLWCDNKAAIHISENPVFHERTKHLDIDCHLVRSKFKEGFVLPQHIYSSQQLADIFTKVVSGPLFRSLQRKLGLIEGVQLEEGVLK